MSQFYKYSASSSSSTSQNSLTIPNYSTLIAGKSPSNTLVPVAVDASGNFNVSIVAPTGVNVNATQAGVWTVGLSAGSNAIGSVSVSNFPSTQPVSGTVAVSSLPSIPAGSNAIGSVSVSSLPSIPAGSNAIGSITNTSFTATQSTASALNATVVGNTAAGSGASTGLVTIQGNASGTPVPISGSVTISPSGTQNVNLSQVGGSSFALGQQLAAASLPVVLTAAQLSTLTPLSSVTVTQATAANLNATVTGTVAATQSGTWNINNVSGTVSLPTGASTSANQTNGTQKTQLVDGSNNVISSTSNALNVNVSSGTVTTTNSANGNTGSAVPTQATYIAGNYGGNLTGLKLDSAGELLVQQADATATGTITSNQSVSIALNGAGTIGIQISGTWTGSITAEGSVDGTNYSALPCAALTSGGIGSVFSVNNIFQASVAGLGFMRMRGTTVATGTATINLISNHSVGALSLLNSLPSGTNIIGSISNISGTVSLPTGAATSANQTTLGSQTTKLNDGTNTAAVKAASTAASATDPALVVAISPNNTIGVAAPTGRARANAPVVTSYSSTNVTSGAYVQLVASTTSAANMIEIFDSSGVALYFATGAAGSEVNQFVIYPGGNGQVNFAIAASTRLSVKAVSTSATSGTGIINIYT